MPFTVKSPPKTKVYSVRLEVAAMKKLDKICKKAGLKRNHVIAEYLKYLAANAKIHTAPETEESCLHLDNIPPLKNIMKP